jgi:hypothetical protein
VVGHHPRQDTQVLAEHRLLRLDPLHLVQQEQTARRELREPLQCDLLRVWQVGEQQTGVDQVRLPTVGQGRQRDVVADERDLLRRCCPPALALAGRALSAKLAFAVVRRNKLYQEALSLDSSTWFIAF